MSTGDDFFFTGGGFSDWSGGSAGNFGSSSGGSFFGGSSFGKGKDDEDAQSKLRKIKAEYQKKLDAEKKNGMPKKANVLPNFITYKSWLFRIGTVQLCICLQSVAALIYVCYPVQALSLLPAIIFVLAGLSFMLLTHMSSNWYVVRREISQREIRLTMTWQKGTVVAGSILQIFVAGVPLLCALFPQFILLHTNVLVFRSIYAADKLHYHLFQGFAGWAICIASILLVIYAFFYLIITLVEYGKTRGSVSERYTYTLYCQRNGITFEKDDLDFVKGIMIFVTLLTLFFSYVMINEKRELEHAEKRWHTNHAESINKARKAYVINKVRT